MKTTATKTTTRKPTAKRRGAAGSRALPTPEATLDAAEKIADALALVLTTGAPHPEELTAYLAMPFALARAAGRLAAQRMEVPEAELLELVMGAVRGGFIAGGAA